MPALLRLADRDDIAPYLRCAAAEAAFVSDGGMDPASRWIESAIEDGTFACWAFHNQVILLRLLKLLPPDRGAVCADTVELWLDDEGVPQDDSRRRLLKWVRSTIAWTEAVEQLPEDQQAKMIVSGAVIGRRPLRLARDPRRRDLVVQEVRKREMPRYRSLLYLLDDLDVQLTADELAMLVMTCDG